MPRLAKSTHEGFAPAHNGPIIPVASVVFHVPEVVLVGLDDDPFTASVKDPPIIDRDLFPRRSMTFSRDIVFGFHRELA